MPDTVVGFTEKWYEENKKKNHCLVLMELTVEKKRLSNHKTDMVITQLSDIIKRYGVPKNISWGLLTIYTGLGGQ